MIAKSSRPEPRLPRFLPVLLAFALVIGCGAGGSNGEIQSGQERPTGAARGPVLPNGSAWVIFGADTVVAELANTSALRQRGLMYRDDVPAGTGMLFVFTDSEVRSFWMQNTYVSLDIAFMDTELRVVDIQQMEARTEDFHESRAPAMYALEVQKGWFAAHNIQIGAQARLVTGG